MKIKPKAIKLFKKIFITLAIIVAIAPVLAYIAFQHPSLQTTLAKNFAGVISKKLGTKVYIEKAYFVFFDKLILKDVYILYNEKDTLFSSKKISASFSARDFLKSNYNLHKVKFEDGVFNLLNEAPRKTNLDRVFKLKENKKNISDKEKKRKPFSIQKLQIHNFRFTFNNSFTSATDYGPGYINFTNLSIRNINSDIRNIQFKKDTLFANILSLSGTDKSNFNIRKFSGDLYVCSKEARISNLIIEDGYTKVNAHHFSFYYNTAKDFGNFTKKVKMELKLNDSWFNFRTIAKITPALNNNFLGMHLRGMLSGPLYSIKAEDLEAISESGFTSIKINARISGLPKTATTMAFMDIPECKTTSIDISNIIAKLNNEKPSPFVQKLSSSIFYNFKGGIAGLLTDFVASGKISSNIGDINLDVLFKSDKNADKFKIKGNINLIEFDAGKLFMKEELGKITLRSTLTSLIDKAGGSSNKFIIDSLFIDKLDLHNYSYRNILANGKFENSIFDGRVICHDPNLDMIFQGVVGFSQKRDSHYDFYANVAYANLAALMLDKRDTVSKIKFKTTANYTQKKEGDIFGNIDINSIKYANSKGEFNIGDIKFKSLSNTNEFSATLNSSFADLEYRGKEIFTKFLKVAKEMVLSWQIPVVFKPNTALLFDYSEKYYVNINFYDTRAISELVLPGLFIARQSFLNIDIDHYKLNFRLKAPQINYKKISVNNLIAIAYATKDSAKCSISSDRFTLSGFNFNNNKIELSSNYNKLKVKTTYKNSEEYLSSLILNTDIIFSKNSISNTIISDILVYSSDLTINNIPWKISDSKITVDKKEISFNNFKISHDQQQLFADGKVSENYSESLSIKVSNLSLDPLNMIISDKFLFNGELSGYAKISDWYKEPAIELDIKGTNLKVNKADAGEINLKSSWNATSKLFDINLENINNGKKVFIANGNYSPQGSALDLNAKLTELPVYYFEPFLKTLISKLSGRASGDFSIKGPVNKLVIESNNGNLTNIGFTVNYTNVSYILDSPFLIAENKIITKEGILKDRYGNIGYITSTLSHDFFKGLDISASMNFKNLECINTKEKDNPAFYGNVFGSGNLTVGGNLKKILMNIELTSHQNTVVHIPLSSSTEATQTNLLTFVNNSEQNRLIKVDSNLGDVIVKKNTSLELKLRAIATPEASLKIEINKALGDVITGYGNGIIDMDIKTAEKTFNIYGDYIIDRGNYQFGYALKQFDIIQGGKISFNGDITGTNLDLTTSYKTKASISTLISDTASIGNRRTIDCQIAMNGPLLNPTLGFNIVIPDLDPATGARVSAALNSEDKILRQIMSILISGNFVPDMESNIVNNTNIIYSNLSEILSNQINSIFNQLDIPLDLNFNYQQGNSGQNIFDAAVSAQLLDNRVIVNGNIGNSPYTTNSNSLAGDLQVEVKLDSKGKIRARVFSRSADRYSNYLEGIQRNGFGVVYQEEFNSFRELFDRLFSKKH